MKSFGSVIEQCRKQCKAPRECLPTGRNGQVECTCKPCPPTSMIADKKSVSTKTKTKLDDSSICTESGMAFETTCELKFSECMNNVSYKVTNDRIICDIKSNYSADALRQ